MKFIELLNGDLLNIDEIKRVYWTCRERASGNLYFSHIEGKNDNVYDFLDFPIFFDIPIEGVGHINLEVEHVNILHQIAMNYIIAQYNDGVIPQELLEKDVWDMFIKAATIKYREDHKND